MIQATGRDDKMTTLTAQMEQAQVQIGQEPKRAVAILKRSLDLAHEVEDPLVKALFWELLGRAYRQSEHRKLAIESWQQARVLLNEVGERQKAASILELMGEAAYTMAQYFKAFTFHSEAMRLYMDLGDKPAVHRQAEIAAWMVGCSGHLDTAQRLFLGARWGFRRLKDRRAEAFSFVQQGKVWLHRGRSEGLGYLRHGLDLLNQLSDDEAITPAISELREYLAELKREWGQPGYQRMLKESMTTYTQAAAEAEVESQRESELHRQLLPELAHMKLVRHDTARDEALAQEAVSLVQRYGFSEIALVPYKNALKGFRRHHHRLAEAIMAGTIGLICQIKGQMPPLRYEDILALYRDAGDLLGQGRTLLNEGISCASLDPPAAEEALVVLRCALELLGQANAPFPERELARSVLQQVERNLGPAKTAKVLKKGQERIAELQAGGRMVTIWRTWPEKSAQHRSHPGKRVATCANLLDATRHVLAMLIEASSQPTPEQVEFTAYGHRTQLTGFSSGRRLPGVSTNGEGRGAPLFRMRYMEISYFEAGEYHPALRPLEQPTQDGVPPGILLVSRDGLEGRVVDYLDHVYTDWDSRAVEVVDQDDQQIFRLGWCEGIYGWAIKEEAEDGEESPNASD